MRATLRASVVATFGFMLLTGLGYPLAVTALCQLLFPVAANGSLVSRADGSLAGSALIAQKFEAPQFFWSRPSSAGDGDDPQTSGPSNLGPLSQKLALSFAAEAQRARRDGVSGPIPADRLTGSGSGLDPDISIENALGQVSRVAKARGLAPGTVEALVRGLARGRDLSLFGEPRVTVLTLNLALEDLTTAKTVR